MSVVEDFGRFLKYNIVSVLGIQISSNKLLMAKLKGQGASTTVAATVPVQAQDQQDQAQQKDQEDRTEPEATTSATADDDGGN